MMSNFSWFNTHLFFPEFLGPPVFPIYQNVFLNGTPYMSEILNHNYRIERRNGIYGGYHLVDWKNKSVVPSCTFYRSLTHLMLRAEEILKQLNCGFEVRVFWSSTQHSAPECKTSCSWVRRLKKICITLHEVQIATKLCSYENSCHDVLFACILLLLGYQTSG